MVLFQGSGRLGNQLFQYAFIKQIRRNKEVVIFSRMDELATFMRLPSGYIAVKGKLGKIFDRFYGALGKSKNINLYVRTIKQLSLSVSGKDIEQAEYSSVGSRKKITYIYPGYFQSEKFWSLQPDIGIIVKYKYIAKARKVLEAIPVNAERAFVHYRRGDYLDIKIWNKPVSLPFKYYKYCIQLIKQNHPLVWFVVVSDDIRNAKIDFAWLDNCIFANENSYVDIMLMAECDYGVMSNSSFSWWGGFFSNRRELFFPNNWMGYASSICYPDGVHPSFATPVDILMLKDE